MPIVNPPLPADGDDAIVSPYNTAINAILGVINGSIDADNLATGAVGLSELTAAVQAMLVPSGVINAYGGTAAPTGWLMCDGSSVLRASYSSLFAIVGTAFGSVDGTHFTLPDLRGRIPVGSDTMGAAAVNRLQRSTTVTTTSGSATATPASMTGLTVGMTIVSTNVPAGTTITVVGTTTITMSANATASASGVAARFSMVADAQAVGSVGGADVHTLIGAQLAAHSHIYRWGDSAAAGGTGNMFAGGFGNSRATDNNVGDQPHPNVQPSQVVNYIIKT